MSVFKRTQLQSQHFEEQKDNLSARGSKGSLMQDIGHEIQADNLKGQ